MANEIKVSASLGYANSTAGIDLETLAATGKTYNISGTKYVKGVMSVPTTAGGTAIPLGGLSTLGFYVIVNKDATNRVDVLTQVGGTIIASLKKGEVMLARFPSTVTAPAVIADAAPVAIEYMILEN